jgi:hypothetical protein
MFLQLYIRQRRSLPIKAIDGFLIFRYTISSVKYRSTHHSPLSESPPPILVLGLYHSISPIPLLQLLLFLPPPPDLELPFQVDRWHQLPLFPNGYFQIGGLWQNVERPLRMFGVLEIWLLVSSLSKDPTYLVV